jgi:hypothetical protein
MFITKQKSKIGRSVIIESIGWFGVLCILLAYGLLNLSKIGSSSFTYLALNTIGGLAIITQSYYIRDWEPIILNIIWVLISLYALGSHFLKF